MQMEAQPTQSSIKYSFFVAGHTYGAPGDSTPGLYRPFLNSFPILTESPRMAFGFLAGDIVQQSTQEHWDAVDRDLAPLPMMTFKVAGNHDYGKEYWHRAQRYGPSWFSFQFYDDLFIVLDGTWDNWSIRNHQFDFLKNTLKTKTAEVNRVFIIVHQLIWIVNDKFFDPVTVNDPKFVPKNSNYATHVRQVLFAADKPLYLIAGDLGANEQASPLMFHQDGEVTYLATGMGGGTHDNLLILNIHTDGTVNIVPIALNGNDPNALGPIEGFQVNP